MKPVRPLTLPEGEQTGGPSRSASNAESRLGEALERYGSFLRRTLSRLCPPPLKAELDDIEQEARIRLWQALRHEREITYPASYIYRIAVSVTIRAVRRARARREQDLPVDVDGEAIGGGAAAFQTDTRSSPEAIVERRTWIERIDRARAQLAENRGVAVGLHLQGLTTTEIADLLGWTEPKARNLVHRGLKDLRRYLASDSVEHDR
jgi:RNA polymerase sigma factor (sigma-70 family)